MKKKDSLSKSRDSISKRSSMSKGTDSLSKNIIWREDSIDSITTIPNPSLEKMDQNKSKGPNQNSYNNESSKIFHTIPVDVLVSNNNPTHLMLSDADYSDNDFFNTSGEEARKGSEERDPEKILGGNLKHLRDKYISIMTNKSKREIDQTTEIDVMEYNIIGRSFIDNETYREDTAQLKLYGKVSLYLATIWMSFAVGYAWVQQLRDKKQMEEFFGGISDFQFYLCNRIFMTFLI